jgi:hypothetical protein
MATIPPGQRTRRTGRMASAAIVGEQPCGTRGAVRPRDRRHTRAAVVSHARPKAQDRALPSGRRRDRDTDSAPAKPARRARLWEGWGRPARGGPLTRRVRQVHQTGPEGEPADHLGCEPHRRGGGTMSSARASAGEDLVALAGPDHGDVELVAEDVDHTRGAAGEAEGRRRLPLPSPGGVGAGHHPRRACAMPGCSPRRKARGMSRPDAVAGLAVASRNPRANPTLQCPRSLARSGTPRRRHLRHLAPVRRRRSRAGDQPRPGGRRRRTGTRRWSTSRRTPGKAEHRGGRPPSSPGTCVPAPRSR